MSSTDRPDVLERVASALTSADLSPRAGVVSQVDLITAMAYAQMNPSAEERPVRAITELDPGERAEIDPRTRLGGLLLRLKLGADGSVAREAAMLLEHWVRHQRAFRRWKLRQGRGDLVQNFVRQCLDEWLFPTCTECHGRQLVGLDRGEIVERRVRCARCRGAGWLNEKTKRGRVNKDCHACGGKGARTIAKVRQRKTEQCPRCKGTGQRIASSAERARALGLDVRVYERHWEKRFTWLAAGLDRLDLVEKRSLQSQLRAGISRA